MSKVSTMFSGKRQFMKNNMMVFQRQDVDVVVIDDAVEDAFGSELREVTVVSTPEDANKIMQDLNDMDKEVDGELQFGGCVRL